MRVDSVKQSNDELRMKISANLQPISSLCCNGVNNPYFVISRARDETNLTEFVRVYKSPHMVNNPSPAFNPIKLKLAQVCNS